MRKGCQILNVKTKTTEYKNVQEWVCRKNATTLYVGSVMIEGKRKRKTFDNIRSAALFIDKALISFGKEPVNILKRKL